jgi:hypothetical protein
MAGKGRSSCGASYQESVDEQGQELGVTSGSKKRIDEGSFPFAIAPSDGFDVAL